MNAALLYLRQYETPIIDPPQEGEVIYRRFYPAQFKKGHKKTYSLWNTEELGFGVSVNRSKYCKEANHTKWNIRTGIQREEEECVHLEKEQSAIAEADISDFPYKLNHMTVSFTRKPELCNCSHCDLVVSPLPETTEDKKLLKLHMADVFREL